MLIPGPAHVTSGVSLELFLVAHNADGTLKDGGKPMYTPTGKDLAIAISTTVVKPGSGLTVPANTTHALVTVESGDIRFTENGVDPTATDGSLLLNGSVVELQIPAVPANLRFIRATIDGLASPDAVINVLYRQYA